MREDTQRRVAKAHKLVGSGISVEKACEKAKTSQKSYYTVYPSGSTSASNIELTASDPSVPDYAPAYRNYVKGEYGHDVLLGGVEDIPKAYFAQGQPFHEDAMWRKIGGSAADLTIWVALAEGTYLNDDGDIVVDKSYENDGDVNGDMLFAAEELLRSRLTEKEIDVYSRTIYEEEERNRRIAEAAEKLERETVTAIPEKLRERGALFHPRSRFLNLSESDTDRACHLAFDDRVKIDGNMISVPTDITFTPEALAAAQDMISSGLTPETILEYRKLHVDQVNAVSTPSRRDIEIAQEEADRYEWRRFGSRDAARGATYDW